MEQIFLFVLNNAITVNALIIAIIAVRALGKKMPKWIICMLWLIVAVKLIVPVHFESGFSLIPTREPISTEIVMGKSAQDDSGVSSLDNEKNFASDTMTDNSYENVTQISDAELTGNVGSVDDDSILAKAEQVMFYLHIGGIVWAACMGVMLLYAVITYILIRKRVSASVKTASGVYECDDISDSFILGIISPRVYLPSMLSEDAKEYILKHEFAHLSRYDHIWKPLGFAILSVYWFNPLCWISYILLCRDIEYACDEKVTRDIGTSEKAEYCRVLLEHSMPRKMLAACPVAFGETDVKNRIKNVVNYKKPAFWITVSSIIVCIAVGVCFATNRGSKEAEQAGVGKQQDELEEELKKKASELAELQNKISELQKQSAELQAIKKEQDEWYGIGADRNISVKARKQPYGAEYIKSDTDVSGVSYTDEDVTELQEEYNKLLEEYSDMSVAYKEKEEELYKKFLSLKNVLEQQQKEMRQNTTPEIKDILVKFYDAVADNNEKVDKYYLLDIYTVPGPVSGSYVVYAYNKVSLCGHEDILVPQVDTFYICTYEDGKLRINCDQKDEAVSSYIKSVSEQPAVVDIFSHIPNEETLRNADVYRDIADIVIEMRKEVEKVLQN